MKPNLQNWQHVPGKWTDKVNWSVNNSGDLFVDNFIPKNIFHYVESEFLTKKVIEGLEKMQFVEFDEKTGTISGITNSIYE